MQRMQGQGGERTLEGENPTVNLEILSEDAVRKNPNDLQGIRNQ